MNQNNMRPSLKALEIESGLAEEKEIDYSQPAPVEYVKEGVLLIWSEFNSSFQQSNLE